MQVGRCWKRCENETPLLCIPAETRDLMYAVYLSFVSNTSLVHPSDVDGSLALLAVLQDVALAAAQR